jgi:hypothetical protein
MALLSKSPSMAALEVSAPLSPPPDASALSAQEQRDVMKAVSRHLLPVCWLSALLAYLDRANLSFAALQMNDDLGARLHTRWRCITPCAVADATRLHTRTHAQASRPRCTASARASSSARACPVHAATHSYARA